MTRKNFSDGSNGYESVASEFISHRSQSTVRVETVRRRAEDFSPGAAILDLGWGNGRPISQIFVDANLLVYGVDASTSMIAAFQAQVPGAQAECSTVEASNFFDRTFDGIIAWGLVFLLTPEAQSCLIRKVSRALTAGGRFLFTSPKQACKWADALTGRKSVSLGVEAYHRILAAEGLMLAGQRQNEGENHYYLALKAPRHGT